MEDLTDKSSMELPEVILLNVGGIHYATSKATLVREKSSMLAALFSGRYKVPKDEHGRFFIDRDGRDFSFILAYLRGESFHPPPHLAEKILEDAEYFQIHGLIEALQVNPVIFQAKLLKRIDDKCQTQFWKHEIVMKSQNKCMETLSLSSWISFIEEESIQLLAEEPSCIESQHSILVTKVVKKSLKYVDETFNQLANRMKSVDCIISNVRTKDMELFISSLQRRLDDDRYSYRLTEETAICNAGNGHNSYNSCEFSIKCFYIEFYWNAASLPNNSSATAN